MFHLVDSMADIGDEPLENPNDRTALTRPLERSVTYVTIG